MCNELWEVFLTHIKLEHSAILGIFTVSSSSLRHNVINPFLMMEVIENAYIPVKWHGTCAANANTHRIYSNWPTATQNTTIWNKRFCMQQTHVFLLGCEPNICMPWCTHEHDSTTSHFILCARMLGCKWSSTRLRVLHAISRIGWRSLSKQPIPKN